MTKESAASGTHTVLSTLIHKGADWKKGVKAVFKKGDAIELTAKEAAPLIARGTVKPGAPEKKQQPAK